MRPVSPCGHRASRLPAKPAGYPLTQGGPAAPTRPRRPAGALAGERAGSQHGHLEDRAGGHADRLGGDNVGIEAVANGLPGRPAAANSSWPGCFGRSRGPRCATSCGSPRTCTARPHTTIRRVVPRGAVSIRCENSFPVHSSRCVRPEQAGPDVRAGGGVHARAARRQYLARRRFPAFRRGERRRRQRELDGGPPRRHGRVTLVEDPAAATTVSPASTLPAITHFTEGDIPS
jgi:hypothetical protein